MIPGKNRRGREAGNKIRDSGLGITIEEPSINISEHKLLCRIQGGLGEEADGGSRVCVSRGGGFVSVALLARVLNIETEAEKRKRLKFECDDLHLLLSLGLSWSCCFQSVQEIWLCCVFCVHLCAWAVCSCRLCQGSCRSRAVPGAHPITIHGTESSLALECSQAE